MDFEQVKAIVLEAGAFLKNREAAAHVTVKGAADYVTEADQQVQNFIQKKLGELYPEIQFLGEEKNNDNIDLSGQVWVLDPVDGTTNLIHDYKKSCISLALVDHNRIAAGIVYQPYTEELYYAERGKGAYLNNKRIFVSGAETMEESLISVGTNPYEKKEIGEKIFRMIYKVFMDCQDIRRGGSAALDLAETAAGRIDGYFEAKLNIWDYAAGQLLVEEAGGVVTDFQGNEISCAMRSSVVCGNKAVHKALVEGYLERPKEKHETTDQKKTPLIVVNAMLVSALIIVVSPLLWIAKYDYPSADDWSFGILSYHALKNGEGLLGVIRAAVTTVMEYRMNWEGRFSIVFLGALQPGIWGEKHYGIVAWLMIGSIILSELYLCNSLLKRYAKDSVKWLSIPIMVPSVILQLLYTPSPEQSFFWYNGSVSYTFAYCLSLILLALFMKLGTEEFKNGGVHIGLAVSVCILAVMVGGNNYSTSLSSLLTLLMLSALFFCFDRRAFYRTWFVTALMGISLWLCASAPGNMVRLNANFGGETAGKMAAVIDSLWYARHALYDECVNIKTILMILLILPFLWKAVKSMDYDFRFPLLFTLITYGLYASQMAPSMYVERGIYTGRLKAILFYSCYVWIVGNVGYWLGWLSKRDYKETASATRIFGRVEKYLLAYSLLIGILFCGVILKSGSGSSFSAYESLRQGLPQQYAKEWDERLKTLHDESVKEVTFVPLSVNPGIILFSNLQPEDGGVWVNAACAQYYDKDVIRIVEEEGEE